MRKKRIAHKVLPGILVTRSGKATKARPVPLLKSNFIPLSSNRSKNLRYEIPISKHLEKFPSALFPQKWNNLGNALKSSKSENSLKKNFKKSTIDKYKSFKCSKRKCFPCNKS